MASSPLLRSSSSDRAGRTTYPTTYPSTAPQPRQRGRLLRRLLACAAGACLALAVGPASAGAIVTEVSGTTVGVTPRNSETIPGGEFGGTFKNASGHPVVHATNAYAVYWDPTDHYHGDWQGAIDRFFHDVNAASGSYAAVFAVDAQYTDLSNKPAAYNFTSHGAYTDTTPYPSSGNCTDPKPLGPSDAITCLTDQQIREELQSFISQHNLQKGMSSIFYVLTPPGVTVCVGPGGGTGHCSDFTGAVGKESYNNSFCSYHADISPTSPTTGDGNTILYAVIPWTAGGAGDTHLEKADRTSGFDCQDGGFDASSKPTAGKKEKTKEKTTKEEEEFTKKTKEEQELQKKREELEGPHQQEPNQQPCPTADGGCDFGLADLIINQVAVQQQNTVTDPLLNAWQDSAKREVVDECRNWFALVLGGGVTANEETEAGTLFNQSLNGNPYYVNTGFNLAAVRLPYPAIRCLPGIRLEPHFTSPSSVNSGELVALNGMESDITLNAAISYSSGGAEQSNYATYEWNFGDGTAAVKGYAPGAPACAGSQWLSPCAASELHSYQYGGTYNVTLKATDVAGNTQSVSNPVTVIGSGPLGASGGSSSQASSSSSSTSGAPAAPAAPKPPAASAAVLSRSLRNVLRGGLVVNYSVAERVTGRFEVLLAKSTAHRIGLHGPGATGLAQGTPPQIVIGKAFLVTTAGGSNRIKIQFSKSTAARLERLHAVALLLRLTVRNASGASTVVLTPITLSH